jgi:hypothetical protein
MKERVAYLSKRPEYKTAYDEAKLIYGLCHQLSSNYDPNLGTVKQLIVKPSDQPYITRTNPVAVDISLVVDERTDENIAKGTRGYFQRELPTPEGEMPPEIAKIGTIAIAGRFDNDANTIHYIDQLKDRIADLRSTVRHELQHFVQEYLAPYAGKAEYGGLPFSQTKGQLISPEGLSTEEPMSWQRKLFDLKDPAGRVYHELRDIEFYTRLSDSIEAFGILRRHFPIALHRDLVRAFIDDMPVNDLMVKVKKIVTDLTYEKYYWKPEYAAYDSETYKKIGDEVIAEIRRFKALTDSWLPDRLFVMLKKHQPWKYEKACSVFMQRLNV